MHDFGLAQLINLAFEVYFIIILIRVIGSWVPPRPGQTTWATVFTFCRMLTEPLLAPLRNLLAPLTGRSGMDLSPLLLWLILAIVRRLLLQFLLRV